MPQPATILFEQMGQYGLELSDLFLQVARHYNELRHFQEDPKPSAANASQQQAQLQAQRRTYLLPTDTGEIQEMVMIGRQAFGLAANAPQIRQYEALCVAITREVQARGHNLIIV
jgi:hypothetical protein